MTNRADLNRLTARIANSAAIFEYRLPYAADNLALHAATSHPTTATGNANTPTGTGTAELTATEAAAHNNLGDLYGYPDTNYQPGPAIRLDDIADELRAALKSMDRAHRALTDCGVPPIITGKYQCRGINGHGCEDWADPNRSDHLCISCGRAVDSNRRRLRRHA